jgi:hypothetical protein
MKVREAVAELLALPQDAEIMDEYAEEILTRFYVSSYDEVTADGENVTTEYVAFDTMEDQRDDPE